MLGVLLGQIAGQCPRAATVWPRMDRRSTRKRELAQEEAGLQGRQRRPVVEAEAQGGQTASQQPPPAGPRGSLRLLPPGEPAERHFSRQLPLAFTAVEFQIKRRVPHV